MSSTPSDSGTSSEKTLWNATAFSENSPESISQIRDLPHTPEKPTKIGQICTSSEKTSENTPTSPENIPEPKVG